MMKHPISVLVIPALLAASLTLGACSSAKEQLGLTRSAPDEFSVIPRAPLEMPPDYATLTTPRPGAPRPQEISPSTRAEAAIFGSHSTNVSGVTASEAALLDAAGAQEAVIGIRDIVDQETATLPPRQQPVAKRLLNIGSDRDLPSQTTIVDPEAEAARLRQNMEEGRPVTEGQTPTIER